MKNRILIAVIVILFLIAAGVMLMGSNRSQPQRQQQVSAPESRPTTTHSHTERVPAYQHPSEIDNLPPTLPAHGFIGKTREAYLVAREMPKTLAQLPCYCECDRGFGHKSLHSCFVDDHASHCAVCVDEALLAYRLRKEEKLTTGQVREIIIQKYSAEH